MDNAQLISGDLKRSIRGLKLTGYAVIIFSFLGFGSWAALAPLSAAAIAVGQVSPDGSQRTIQHLEGGIIGELHVREGSKVRKGQALVTLDKAQAEANFRSKYRKLQRLVIVRDRLLAEQRSDSSFRVESSENPTDDPSFSEFVENEIAAFRIKRELLDQKREVYDRQENQVSNEIDSIEAQAAGMSAQLELIGQEIDGKRALVKKGLVRMPELLALERKQAELVSEGQALASTAARAGQKIEEIRIAKITVATEALDAAAAKLTEVNNEIALVEEALSSTNDILDRTEILAPIDGTVLELHYRTIGGVVRPGEPILTIVPDNEELIVDARLGPSDIDNVAPGMEAKVQITSFMARHLLPLNGQVMQVGADVVKDPNTHENYYPLRVRVDQADIEKALGNVSIQPGMPTEVFVQTGTHTLLRYFADPILHSFNRAFREEVMN
jgi:HlyD family secretion protein/epimerase transport system membrane fusion protein